VTVAATGGRSGSGPIKVKTIPAQAQNNPLISSQADGQSIIIAPGQDFIMKVKPINPGQLKKLTLYTDDREIPFTSEPPLPPIDDVVYEAVVAFTNPDVYPYVIVAEYASSTLITRGNFNVRYSSSNENNIRALPGTDYSEVEKPSQPISEKQYESLLQDPKEFLRRDTGIVKLYNTVGEFIKDPTISLLSKILRALGIVMGSFLVISGLLKNPFSIAEILSVPTRLMSILLSTLGLKKKNHPWGTVYDSMTKQPIDPAIVTLYDVSGNEVGSCITDLDGRYSFLVPPGTYTITAAKTNYSFPSKKLTGRSSDELYPDLYFGEQITITSASDVVAKNIPLDREKFDWNEYAKSKSKVMSFYTKWDVFIQKISSTFFISGFGLSILSIIYIPEPYNFIILILYIIISISYILGIRPRLYGTVKDKDGNPLSMGIIRFRYLTLGDEILHRVIDEYGRYYALVPKGSYVVSIEKKNTDGSYEPVYTSAVINADKGIIKKRFVV
jgi:hypothetical protein